MPSGVSMQLERWLLAGLSLLALAGAVWMLAAPAWPAEFASPQFMLVEAWQKIIVQNRGERVAGLLPKLVAIDALLAAGIALALALSAATHVWLRGLRRALAFGACAALHLFQVRLLFAGSDGLRAVLDIAAFVLAACAVVDLLMFFADYPRRINHEELRGYFQRRARAKSMAGLHQRFIGLLDGLNTRLYGLDTVERSVRNVETFWRIIAHTAFRPAILGLAVLAGLQFAFGLFGKAGSVVSYSAVMFIAMLLPMMGFIPLIAKYVEGTTRERHQIGWIYLGPIFGFVIAALAHMGPMLASFVVPDAYAIDGFRLFGLPLIGWWLVGVLAFMPLLIASFLLGLAISVFYTGSIDPKLAIRRSLMVGISAILLTVVFVALENLLSSEMAARLGLSNQTGALISGVAAALVFAPLRSKLESAVARWLDRFMPRIEPDVVPEASDITAT